MSGLLCFALPIFVATVYFGWLYWRERQFIQRLLSEGQSATAMIMQRESQFAGRGGTVYIVAYQFEALKGGETVTQQQREQVSTKLFKRLNEGERVPIRYLAGDLTTARLDGEYQDRSKATSYLVLSGFCAVVSVLFVIAMVRTG